MLITVLVPCHITLQFTSAWSQIQSISCANVVKKLRKFVNRFYFGQKRGPKFKLQRTRSNHVTTKESDWLIYARAFLLLCYVTKDDFQLQNKNHLIQLCFAEKSDLKKWRREAFSILLREREEEIGS